jgi:succinylarginine dihydrolase
MPLLEINFDGIVGPSHNYAGLSPGNLAATANAGDLSFPRAAALQGLDKMLGNLELGLAQGFFVPPPRPNTRWLNELASDDTLDPALRAGAWSASAMWTANAATVSPAPDTRDGRCHLTVANLITMPHRSHEWPDTLRQLRLAFADERHFAVHGPVPFCFGDEGAANHMRLAPAHDAPGVEVFVYGRVSGRFPARQNEQAGRVIARSHGLYPDRTLFIEQSADAIAAGAFHNDVVAVANETVVLAHERAFADPEKAWQALAEACPSVQIVAVPERVVSLEEAIRSYLFNAQLVTLPEGGQALIVPNEAWESLPVRRFLDGLVASNGPIRQVRAVNVRQSMANGGGPACLRLRVVAAPETVDPRFLLNEAKAIAIRQVIAQHWPEQIAPGDLGSPALARDVAIARNALLDALDLLDLA